MQYQLIPREDCLSNSADVLKLVIPVSGQLSLQLKGKLGEIFLLAQRFYLTLTKRSFNMQF